MPVLGRLLLQADPFLPEEAAYEKARRSIAARYDRMKFLKLFAVRQGGTDRPVRKA